MTHRAPETAGNYEAAGLKYDSSLSYADLPGFRCGVCYECPLFDIENRVQLKVKERPLIAMECTIIHKNYMNLGYVDISVYPATHSGINQLMKHLIHLKN